MLRSFSQAALLLSMSFLIFPCGPRPPLNSNPPSTNIDADSAFKSKFNSLTVLNKYNRPKTGSISHPEPEIAKDEVFYFAGGVFTLVQEKPLDTTLTLFPTVHTVLKNDYKPEIKTFDKSILFERLIDKSLKTNIGVLSLVKSDLSDSTRASVIYETLQKVIVDRRQGIDSSALQKLKNVDWNENVKRVYIVLSATLNRLSSKKFQRLHSGAKVSGMAFSVGGEIFQSEAETQNFYEVILSGFPLDLEEKLNNQTTANQLKEISDLYSISVDSLKNILYDPYSKTEKTQEFIKLLNSFHGIPENVRIGYREKL